MIRKLPSDVSNLFERIAHKAAVFVFATDWLDMDEDLKTLVSLRLQSVYGIKRDWFVNAKQFDSKQLFHFCFVSIDPESNDKSMDFWSEDNLIASYDTPKTQNWKVAYQEAIDQATHPFRSVRTNKDYGL